MKTVYLKSGQKANLLKKISDDEYLVEPLFEGYYEGDEYEYAGDKIVVDAVLETAPALAFDEQIKQKTAKLAELQDAMEEGQKALRKLKSDIERLNRTETDLRGLILNGNQLKNAESITVFHSDGFIPHRFEPKNVLNKNLTFTIEYKISAHGVPSAKGAWYGECKWDDSPNYVKSVKSEDIYIDKSEAEIEDIAKQRVWSTDLTKISYERKLFSIPEKYLSPEQLAYVQGLRDSKRQKSIDEARKSLRAAQEKLDNLLAGS